MFTWIRGLFRLSTVILLILLGMLAIAILNLFPLRYRRVRLAAWPVTLMARILTLIFKIQIDCPDPRRILRHRGFIFPNHCSSLDAVLMLYYLPVRFLAAIEVRERPLIGWVAQAIGTIFVVRENRSSRTDARMALVRTYRMDRRPPIVLFPEGRLGPGRAVFPFRSGAFAVAAENRISYLTCAVVYDPLEIAIWRGGAGESLTTSLWRIACYKGPIRIRLIPLSTVHPRPTDDPAQLAAAAEAEITERLAVAYRQLEA